MRVLVTGSCGLIGSEAAHFYATQEHDVVGIDNNLRRYFFGAGGDTSAARERLESQFKNYTHVDADIRNRDAMLRLFKTTPFDLVIHAASQPSHDWAAREPFTDFDVNAGGTLNLLEAARQSAPETVFIFLSTNKVYGDAPNHLPLEETATRWELKNEWRGRGIPETLSVDQCTHSLFGASKLAADVLCQEYARYFGLRTAILRGGCLTGPRHAGVALHGFLSFLVKCAVEGQPYTIIGYKGKQVRDQIHSNDVLQAIELFRAKPRPGQVYNLGGGPGNSASILELVTMLEKDFKLRLKTDYKAEARIGDHICYYSDLTKLQSHYPQFRLKYDLRAIVAEMVESSERARKAA